MRLVLERMVVRGARVLLEHILAGHKSKRLGQFFPPREPASLLAGGLSVTRKAADREIWFVIAPLSEAPRIPELAPAVPGGGELLARAQCCTQALPCCTCGTPKTPLQEKRYSSPRRVLGFGQTEEEV